MSALKVGIVSLYLAKGGGRRWGEGVGGERGRRLRNDTAEVNV